MLDAVTKDQLNTGLTGQIRYRVSRAQPLRLSVRREEPDRPRHGLLRLDPARAHRQLRGADGDATRARASRPMRTLVSGISINDLRKNLRDLNDHMDQECRSSAARYGIDARRLAHHRASIRRRRSNRRWPRSTPRTTTCRPTSAWPSAGADQKIVQSKRAVEIETLQGAGRSRAAAAARRAAERSEAQRSARAAGLPAQRPARPATTRRTT